MPPPCGQYPYPLISSLRQDERHQAEEVEILLVVNEVLNLVGGEAGGEVEAVVEDLDGSCGGRSLEDDGNLHGRSGGAVEVVRVTSASSEVEGRLGLGVTSGENLDDVGLTASTLLRAGVVTAPAAALAVLTSSGNLAVEHPESRHIHVPARLTA